MGGAVAVITGLTIFAFIALSYRRRQRKIEGLRDHYVICGHGRVGRRMAEELSAPREAVAG